MGVSNSSGSGSGAGKKRLLLSFEDEVEELGGVGQSAGR